MGISMDKKSRHHEDIEDEKPEESPERKEDQTASLLEENQTLKDTILRKTAELENLRKRLEKEKEDAIKYSNSRFAKDLLAAADNFDRVMENSDSIKDKVENDATWKSLLDGILLSQEELVSVFKKYGICKIDISDGAKFDPKYHQAMCEIDSPDHEVGTVVKVLQDGYVYNDRLLRPVMVVVSKEHG
jgi:molecular chaperone GrpE